MEEKNRKFTRHNAKLWAGLDIQESVRYAHLRSKTFLTRRTIMVDLDFLRRHVDMLIQWTYTAEVMAAHLNHVIKRGRTDPSDLSDVPAVYDHAKGFFPIALEACGEARSANIFESFAYYCIATGFVTISVNPEPQTRDEVNAHIQSYITVIDQLITEQDITTEHRNAFILTQSFFAKLAELGYEARTLKREEADDD